MDLIVIFVSKLLDCAFGALKTSFFIRNKFVISAMCASFSTVFFILSIKQSGLFAYFAIFIATFLGNYFPPVVIKKLEKDKLFVYEITADTFERSINFAETLRELNIPIATTKIRDKYGNRNLTCTCYAMSKEISSIILDNTDDTFKVNKRSWFCVIDFMITIAVGFVAGIYFQENKELIKTYIRNKFNK